MVGKIGESFKIALDSNPTTGYHWEPDYDEGTFQVSSEFRRKSEGVGGGGTQIFKVVPLREGEFSLRVRYRRSWENEPIKEEVYTISVSH